MDVVSFEFTFEGRDRLGKAAMGRDWPVVYLINNDSEIYIGETCSVYNRFSQHLQNPDRNKLNTINVIIDDQFNKSAVLDIEQSLIQLCNADEKFRLQNLNAGLSVKYNYYQREMYVNKLHDIWKCLRDRKLVDHDFFMLKNSNLFKYSPYMTLTVEQSTICNNVIHDILEKLAKGEKGTSVINGSAGTGKTVMAINMIFTLINADRIKIDTSDITYGFTDEQMVLHELHEFLKHHDRLKIGFVLPMTSIRMTMSTVFKKTGNGLKGSMVIGPVDVTKEHYDVLFVDESHRLAKRKNIPNMGAFDSACRSLKLEPEYATQLDWIMKCSDYQVLFYDKDQTVKGSDISPEQFDKTIGPDAEQYFLRTQMRCAAGNDYPRYLKNIFECKQEMFDEVKNYDFRIFDDVDMMVKRIKSLNSEHKLCRIVAGYSWKWISKGHKAEEIKAKHLEDIHIGLNRYVWNMSNMEWILRENSIDEIGCIHTSQGYDLNYVGVIFGYEIDYDEAQNKIVIDLSKFYDMNVKKATDENQVKKYIINAYQVMMTRGIKGCYVYACNPGLNEYLKRFIRD
jgi:uncharacterized protein